MPPTVASRSGSRNGPALDRLWIARHPGESAEATVVVAAACALAGRRGIDGELFDGQRKPQLVTISQIHRETGLNRACVRRGIAEAVTTRAIRLRTGPRNADLIGVDPGAIRQRWKNQRLRLWIPTEVRRGGARPLVQLLVGLIDYLSGGSDGGSCHALRSTLADRLEVSVDQIDRADRTARRLGYLTGKTCDGRRQRTVNPSIRSSSRPHFHLRAAGGHHLFETADDTCTIPQARPGRNRRRDLVDSAYHNRSTTRSTAGSTPGRVVEPASFPCPSTEPPADVPQPQGDDDLEVREQVRRAVAWRTSGAPNTVGATTYAQPPQEPPRRCRTDRDPRLDTAFWQRLDDLERATIDAHRTGGASKVFAYVLRTAARCSTAPGFREATILELLTAIGVDVDVTNTARDHDKLRNHRASTAAELAHHHYRPEEILASARIALKYGAQDLGRYVAAMLQDRLDGLYAEIHALYGPGTEVEDIAPVGEQSEAEERMEAAVKALNRPGAAYAARPARPPSIDEARRRFLDTVFKCPANLPSAARSAKAKVLVDDHDLARWLGMSVLEFQRARAAIELRARNGMPIAS